MPDALDLTAILDQQAAEIVAAENAPPPAELSITDEATPEVEPATDGIPPPVPQPTAVLSETQRNALSHAARTGKMTPEARQVIDAPPAPQAVVTPAPEPTKVTSGGDEPWALENAKLRAALKFGLTDDQTVFLDAPTVDGVMAKAQLFRDELDRSANAAAAKATTDANATRLPTLKGHTTPRKPATIAEVVQANVAAFVTEQNKRLG